LDRRLTDTPGEHSRSAAVAEVEARAVSSRRAAPSSPRRRRARRLAPTFDAEWRAATDEEGDGMSNDDATNKHGQAQPAEISDAALDGVAGGAINPATQPRGTPPISGPGAPPRDPGTPAPGPDRDPGNPKDPSPPINPGPF
jgi:hypothetical protein